jgi:hypothetical protein
MSILIKSVLLTGVLMVVFVTSGWLANWVLLLTGCVYISTGVFSMLFMALGAGVCNLCGTIWQLVQHLLN